jgi:hypothetical protein
MHFTIVITLISGRVFVLNAAVKLIGMWKTVRHWKNAISLDFPSLSNLKLPPNCNCKTTTRRCAYRHKWDTPVFLHLSRTQTLVLSLVERKWQGRKDLITQIFITGKTNSCGRPNRCVTFR